MQKIVNILSNIGHKKIYKTDNILFLEGEMPHSLFILINGSIKLYKSNKEGKEMYLHTINTTSFIAEMPTFMNIAYPASAKCMNKCEILEVNLDAFKQKVFNDKDFCFNFIASLCNKIRILESHITKSSQNLKERLARYLLANKNTLQTISQRQIADSLNTSAESISRIIRELKNHSLIETKKGKIHIIDSVGLQEIYTDTQQNTYKGEIVPAF